MRPVHLSLGVIIAIILIFYWWSKDHPSAQQTAPVRSGALTEMLMDA